MREITLAYRRIVTKAQGDISRRELSEYLDKIKANPHMLDADREKAIEQVFLDGFWKACTLIDELNK